jgi:hypothetical protein
MVFVLPFAGDWSFYVFAFHVRRFGVILSYKQTEESHNEKVGTVYA